MTSEIKIYLKKYSSIKKIADRRWAFYHMISTEIYLWKMFILMQIPGRIGSSVRKKLLGFKKCGENVMIWHHAWFKLPKNIIIGDESRIHPMTYIDASGGLEIGSNVGISPGVQIYTQNHSIYKGEPYYTQPYRLGKVIIEDDCWIGAGAIITAGVIVRVGTIVAAGAVVTKNTEQYSIVAGVPAQSIGKRKLKQ
jgi:acetyltransferase-like isoleucine patch superfamily enzyme